MATPPAHTAVWPDTTPTRWARGLLAVLVALFLLLASLYAVALPVFEGFDAQAHYAAANYYRAERRLPVLDLATAARSYELVPHPPLYYLLSAVAATGWPEEAAVRVAEASVNPYFDKSLSHRQSITLPQAPAAALAPAWIARLVAMLGGLVTLLCTWWLARRLAPSQPTFALAAAAVATLNPQFLFMAVTISNDAWAAATAALALAVGAELYLQPRPPRRWFWAGAAVGLAALAKVSALLVAAPLGLLYLLMWRRDGWRAALRVLGFAALGFALVAGWWFVRNVALYGEVVPLERMAQVLPTMRRPVPFTVAETLDHVPWLIASFWGVFVAVIAPAWYLDATRWFMLVGAAGLVPLLIAMGRRRAPADGLLLVLLAWLGVVALSVLYWTRTIDYGEQGRLAHIGAAAFGVLMAAGWEAWLPPRLRPGLHVAMAAFMGGVALALVPFLAERFGIPPAVAAGLQPDRPLDVRFEGGMRLLGADFPAGAAVDAGRPLPVTLYFTADAPLTEDYTLFLHLAGDDNRLLAQFDGVPAGGLHPTRQWAPGKVFADRHELWVDELTGDGLATLSAGFYPIDDPAQRQASYDAGGQNIGDRVLLAAVRLHTGETASPAQPAEEALARWENGIALAAAHLRMDGAGLPAGVDLTWAPTATIHTDYTVFVQLLDAQNQVLAQADRQPQGGASPTSTWRAGDHVPDSVEWQGDVAAWEKVIVGFYGADGRRLPLVAPEGDVFVLATRAK